MPKYNRAKLERTPEQDKARELQSSYVSSVEGFIRQQEKSLQRINIIHQPKAVPENGFYVPGMDRKKQFIPSDPALVAIVDMPDDNFQIPLLPDDINWRNKFLQ